MVGRQIVQIDQHRKVIARFRRYNTCAVFSLEDLLGAIPQKLFVAFDCNGDEDFGFTFGCRDVKGDVVEVRNNLVNGNWRGSGLLSAAVSMQTLETRATLRSAL